MLTAQVCLPGTCPQAPTPPVLGPSLHIVSVPLSHVVTVNPEVSEYHG